MGDPSALIFVALAVAWAVYLIPKALEHHEESARNKGVENFSGRMKVLARRDAVSRRHTELVDPAAAPAQPTAKKSKAPRKNTASKKPKAAKVRRPMSAARRRRRVLALCLIACAAVVGLAVAGVVEAVWIAAPAGVLVAWLVACRLMVRGERRRMPARKPTARPLVADIVTPDHLQTEVDDEGYPSAPPRDLSVRIDIDTDMDTDLVQVAHVEVAHVEIETTGDLVMPAPLGPKPTWEPQPLTLPMYVSKAPAPRRTVMTIDLESTGVWTSGHTDADSELVRQADEITEETGQERRSS